MYNEDLSLNDIKGWYAIKQNGLSEFYVVYDTDLNDQPHFLIIH